MSEYTSCIPTTHICTSTDTISFVGSFVRRFICWLVRWLVHLFILSNIIQRNNTAYTIYHSVDLTDHLLRDNVAQAKSNQHEKAEKLQSQINKELPSQNL